jgi:hypothetical protein
MSASIQFSSVLPVTSAPQPIKRRKSLAGYSNFSPQVNGCVYEKHTWRPVPPRNPEHRVLVAVGMFQNMVQRNPYTDHKNETYVRKTRTRNETSLFGLVGCCSATVSSALRHSNAGANENVITHVYILRARTTIDPFRKLTLRH